MNPPRPTAVASATPQPNPRSAAAGDPIPLLDLKEQYRGLRDEILPLLEAICDSQQFILGRHVTELEQSVAAYCGARFGIGVSSGTDALTLALMALSIEAGDEVITSPFTFFATAGTIARAGVRPVFCDIERDTFNLSPQRVREFIERDCERRDGGLVNRRTGGRVRALMPVHLYGQCADMTAFSAIAAEHGLATIEDAAQAIGAEHAGRRAGGLGTIGCLSFFPTKNLGAFGDAGMCTTQDAALAERMQMLRVHGARVRNHHELLGANFRIDELQAAVLVVKFKRLEQWTAARQRNAAHYDAQFRAAGLHERIGLPAHRPGDRHVYNQYVIRAPRRDALRAFLAERGIGSEVYYPVPLHRQPCFAELGIAEGALPQAESAAREVLALPIYPELRPQQLDRVVSAIADFFS